MASTYKSALVDSNQVFTPPGGGVVGVREATYALTGALVADDVIQMIPVAKGERVVDIQLIVESDLDSDGTPAVVLDVGDGDDTDRYIDGATVGQAGGVVAGFTVAASAAAAAALNKKYTAADTIDILVQVAPDASATTGTLRLRAFVVRA